MAVLARKGILILSKDGHRSSGLYRKIVELLARFGYASIREVMYGWSLNLTSAVDRLRYLEKAGLIGRFPSHTVPASFFCLTPVGRQMARHFGISEEVAGFVPSKYQLVSHHLFIIKVHLGLRKLLGDRLLGWTSERTLKAEQEAQAAVGNGKRVLDGELFLNVNKTRYKAHEGGKMTPLGEPTLEKWRCGIEVELSLKSPERYKKQFKDLASRVYDGLLKEQHYRMVVFFYTTPTLRDCLARHLKSGRYTLGDCVFYLVQIDEFLERLGEASVERIIDSTGIQVSALDMGEIKVVTQ